MVCTFLSPSVLLFQADVLLDWDHFCINKSLLSWRQRMRLSGCACRAAAHPVPFLHWNTRTFCDAQGSVKASLSLYFPLISRLHAAVHGYYSCTCTHTIAHEVTHKGTWVYTRNHPWKRGLLSSGRAPNQGRSSAALIWPRCCCCCWDSGVGPRRQMRQDERARWRQKVTERERERWGADRRAAVMGRDQWPGTAVTE